MSWDLMVADSVSLELAAFGQPITYSRQASQNTDAIAPFTLTGILTTAGKYADPTGPEVGSVFVRITDIPLGPKKGDFVITPDNAVWQGRTFKVGPISANARDGHATLEIRWIGAQ
jgi:hypothetical protein